MHSAHNLREKKRLKDTFDLRNAVHESERANLKPGIEPEHRFEVTLEPDKFTEEKFKLFDNYQRHVHHEEDGDITSSGFKRFLCSSPVSRHTDDEGKKFGSFHQCYRLDGRLIAMAVLDLLPHAVSGVYFIYHSDFEKWSFGKLSALREACLALEQGYQYYYMGYYIHSCKKMRYKGDYKQQYVLDYNSLQWDPLNDDMRRLMENSKYASMSKHRSKDASGVSNQEDEVKHPTPTQAMKSGQSLLQLGMPGVLGLDQLRREVRLDHMKVHLGRGSVHEIQVSQPPPLVSPMLTSRIRTFRRGILVQTLNSPPYAASSLSWRQSLVRRLQRKPSLTLADDLPYLPPISCAAARTWEQVPIRLRRSADYCALRYVHMQVH